MECLRCGNCCPDTCDFKKKEENGLFTCIINPAMTGKSRNMLFCDLSPIDYYLSGIACRASLVCFEKDWEAFMKSDRVEKLPNGQVILKVLTK